MGQRRPLNIGHLEVLGLLEAVLGLSRDGQLAEQIDAGVARERRRIATAEAEAAHGGGGGEGSEGEGVGAGVGFLGLNP